MAGSFFSNCTHFEIKGGEFNEVKGNLTQYYETTTYAMTGSHNFGSGRPTNESPGHHSTRSSGHNSAYRRPQDGPARSQSHSGAFHPEDPYSYSYARQTNGPIASLPDPRVRSPEDEISAQFRGPGKGKHTDYAPPLQSTRSAPPPQSSFSPTSAAAPWPPSTSTPMARPNNLSRQRRHNTGDAMLRSSPPDDAQTSWAPRRTPPSNGQLPQRSQTAMLPQTRHNSHRRPGRRQPSDDESDSSGSESENDMRTALRGHQPPRDLNSEWRF